MRARCEVVVTGAAGMLGSAVTARLAAAGRACAGLVRGPHPAIDPVQWREVDLTDTASLLAILDELQPRAVINCAALTDVNWCETHSTDAMRVNAGVAADLARWAAANGARLVHVSTDSVFFGGAGPYDEDAAPAPVNAYARSKLAGEVACEAAPDALVVRTNFFGWSPPGKPRLCEWALERLQRGEALPGFVDVLFAPLAADEVADTLCRLAGAKATGILHLASTEGFSKYEFLRQFASGLGYSPDAVQPSRAADAAFIAPRPLDTRLRTRRAAEAGLEALPTSAQAVARFTAQSAARHTVRQPTTESQP